MKKASPHHNSESQPTNSQAKFSTDAAAQRARLLKRLREHPINTLEARQELDIFSPAPRVHELRHNYGYNIHTSRVTIKTDAGQTHNIAQYSLLAGTWKGNAA